MPPNTTIWPVEPQTEAKHEILRRYLGGWFGKMGHSLSRAVFFDAFAGPGEYADGSPGSPLIALDVLRHHRVVNTPCEFVLLFNEKDAARFEHLRNRLELEAATNPLPSNVKVILENSDFSTLSNNLSTSLANAKQRLAPTFAFLDPFGYTGLTMAALQSLFSWDKMDLLIYLDTNSLNRFATSGQVDAQFSDLFGSTEFRNAPPRGDSRRLPFLVDLYARQLKEQCNFRYTQTFQMRNSRGLPSYCLVYATGHPAGLELIKDAMWKIAPDGSFAFDARLAGQDQLPMGDGVAEAVADSLMAAFSGKSVPVLTLESFVVGETPFLKSHLRKGLRILEGRTQITVSRSAATRRGGSYPDDATVSFS